MANSKFWEYSITDEINVFISSLSLIFSALTLFIAYKIYKNFDAKKTHVNKQLETVLNLVEDINKTIISVSFKNKIPKDILEDVRLPGAGKSAISTWPYSLFIISELNNSSHKYDHVVLDGDTEVFKVLPFIKYINNPLLPTLISKKLRAFYSPYKKFSHFDSISENFVVLNSDNKDEMFEYLDFIPAFKNWDGFIQCSKDLKIEIQKWLKKHGAEDINFNHTVQVPIEK
jgi:hypothetical protein